PLTYEDLTARGVSMGSATVTVIAENGPFLARAKEITNFFARETCRQCGPCFNGTGVMDKLLGQFVKGKGKAAYLDQLESFSRTLRRRGACAHLDGAALVMASLVREFRPDLEQAIAG
ncbi:MAG: NADH-ubiquinone oxidoreductase-F iron-sulfur binding region domain-containing protein, partial [Candidatus Binatia bacterium]